MRNAFIITLFLFTSQRLLSQKKFFFDNIDLLLNVHVGDASIEKGTWTELIKEKSTNYQIDTFQYAGINRASCIIFPFIPTSVSAGIRVGKNLFPNAEHNLLANRVEWRSGLFVGSKLQSSTFLTDQNYQNPPQVPYRYREVNLTYRRSWIDHSNQIVYKIPSWLFRKKLKYYIGTGFGFTFEANSKISENYVQNLVTQSGSSYTITEEINTTRNDKAKTITSTYWNLTGGSEFKCSERIYFLFEGNYQGYINTFGLRKRLYKDGGYLSLIFRYSF